MTRPDDIPAEFADLAVALRGLRPAIDPGFAARLDERAARGFPRERRRRFAWLRAKRRVMLPALGFAASLVLVVVVVSGIDSTRTITSNMEGSEALPREDATEESAGGRAATGSTIAPAPPTGGGSPSSDARRDRRVERSAALTLAVAPDGLDEAANAVVRVTDAVGGFVESSSVSAAGDGGQGTFQLRVPSDRLSQALADLSRLGDVRSREDRQLDITAQAVSAASRLREARAEREGLLRQLARADTPAETASIRARLRGVNARIAAAKVDRARVENRARFATVAVTLTADGAAADEEDGGAWTPGDAFDDAVRVLEVAAGVAVVVLALGLPLLLLALLASAVVRRATRRRRERVLDAI